MPGSAVSVSVGSSAGSLLGGGSDGGGVLVSSTGSDALSPAGSASSPQPTSAAARARAAAVLPRVLSFMAPILPRSGRYSTTIVRVSDVGPNPSVPPEGSSVEATKV